MTDSTMTGINPIWAVAIVLLFFLFERRGFGDMFGGGHPAIFNAGGYGQDCVTNKNVLETIFATSTATTKQLDAISQQQTANWYNLGQKIDNMQADTLRQQLQDAKNENLYLRGKIEADARYNSLQSQIASLSCAIGNIPQNPKFIPAGGFECFVPYNSCCPSTSGGTTTSKI